MIRNFFTVAIRSFFKQKFFSFINVFGLASGLTCAIFIYLWVSDEVSKDKFHQDSEKIYQVVSNLELSEGEILTWPITPGPLADDIRENVAEVEFVVRTNSASQQLFQYGDKSFNESGLFADPDFFKLFSFKILSGKPSTDSADVSTISISESLSEKLFGNEDPIGKVIKYNTKFDFTVGAVFQDPGAESSLKFDYILPFEIYRKNRGDGFHWGNYDHPLYLKLYDVTASDAASKKINERRAALAQSGNEDNVDFYLQPFTEYYLNGQYENGKPVGGRIKYVRIFAIVAIFILVIACINFMNMATAKAMTRAKEVGVRKAIGAQRQSLIVQFLSESFLISALSILIAIGLVYMLLPMFNELVAKQIVLQLTDIKFLLTLLTILILTGLLAGIYPAFFLSSYKAVNVLKGSSAQNAGGSVLRKALVVFQFSLTVILIACSLVVYNQIDFIMNKNLGYSRESVLTFRLRGNLTNEFDAFKNEALSFPGVVSVSRANQSLVEVNNQTSSVGWQGKPDNSDIFFRSIVTDYDFLETMGLQLTEGRLFKKEFNDTSNFVVTKKAVETMNMKDPIGQSISLWGVQGKIVGVVEDFHGRSMHEGMDPFVFMCKPEWTGTVAIRFDGSKTQEAIAHLEKTYKKFNAEYPFVFSFADDDFKKLYSNEKVTASLALGFTVMAIIISGLGLLGLAAYTAERKKKEISIRKTLGASVSGIVAMMSGDFVKLSLIAAVIGCPIAYYFMSKFLEGYAFHTELSWWLFALTALSVLAISLATIIFQVIKAAIANPVNALRNE